jgi:hypothetical protein
LGVPVVRLDAGGEPTKAKITGAKTVDPSSVAIPAKWEELNWQALRKLATDLGATVTNKDSAVAAIEAEVKKRAAAAQAAS